MEVKLLPAARRGEIQSLMVLNHLLRGLWQRENRDVPFRNSIRFFSYPNRKGRIMYAYLYIAIGTLLIAIGGLMATYGWNLKTSKEIKGSLEESRIHEVELQREWIIKTVFLETITNLIIIHDSKFTETDEKKLSKFVVYPRLRTAALTSVLESALFLEKRHRRFFDVVSWMIGQLNHFNHRIGLIEDIMRRAPTPERILSLRKSLRDSPTMLDINKNHETFLTVLSGQYEHLLLAWSASELDEKEKAIIDKYLSQKNQNKKRKEE